MLAKREFLLLIIHPSCYPGTRIQLLCAIKQTPQIKQCNIGIYFTDPNIKGYRFVGATDEGDEGKWKWINGDTDSFNQFSWFKLNNADDDFTGMPANCGALGTARYAIIDEYCLQDHNYICESV